MFFKDIDTWDKKKLVLVTAIIAVLYFIATCVIPCIFLACNYGIFERSSNYKLTGAGLIIAVILISFGGKAIKTLLGFLPRDTQKQQILRYTIEMIFALIIPALCLWGIHLFKTNVELACKTATQCIISVMFGIAIDNMALKTLTYQWQCMSEVSHNKKIKRMEQAQKN